jgi:Cys-tRNA(Pro)/Cys-tRNA(Cys) deacylase
MKPIEKTNALRALDKAGVSYLLHTYDSNGSAVDAVEVSQRLGQPIEKIYKTLVTIGASKRNYVLVINGADELDLKKAASFLNEKNLELIPMASLLGLTGYVRGGCSPIGMKRALMTVYDAKILRLDSVIVSAGKIGLQMEIKPDLLINTSTGQVADLIKSKQPD